eukprot:snap_masked-scaffold_1-processed-gene-3.29-mRNA-1 protein AED:1.00 eAED:1.00 QI:0/0/0/0/1/1/2/0/78
MIISREDYDRLIESGERMLAHLERLEVSKSQMICERREVEQSRVRIGGVARNEVDRAMDLRDESLADDDESSEPIALM